MITPFPKIFVIKVVILQLESVGHQQRHNPLAYMTYIYSILSLECIIGRFSNMAVFGCLVSGERLCCHVLAYISRVKSKTGSEKMLFSV